MIFFYISTTNSINNKRKIIITKDKIKKSFLFIISPPFLKKKSGNHPTIEHSLHISITNSYIKYNILIGFLEKLVFVRNNVRDIILMGDVYEENYYAY